MPRYAQKSSYTPAPSGLHVAWLWAFIDLGTQLEKSEKFGDKQQRKGRLYFVLPNELMPDGRPQTISKKYTLSGHEKSNFRKDLGAWNGIRFSDAQFAEYDERDLFNKPCLLTIMHEEGQDGTYAMISAIAPLMAGMEAPPAPDTYIYLSLEPDRFDLAEFDKIGQLFSENAAKRLQETIVSSPEWHNLVGGSHQQEAQQDDQQWATEDPPPEEPVAQEQVAPPPARPAPAPARGPAVAPARAAPAPAARHAAPQQAPAQAARPGPAQRPAAAPAAAPRGPAPARPVAGAGSISQRAVGAPAARGPAPADPKPQMTPVARAAIAGIDDEIPFAPQMI